MLSYRRLNFILLLVFILIVFAFLISILSATALIGLFLGFKFLIVILDFSLTIFPLHRLCLKALIGAIDIFLESYTGTNLLGYGELYGRRIVSFFKDEPIVASYINAFYLILIGFLYDKFTTQHKSKILLLSLFFLFAIFLTGERSNTIKAFLGIIVFYTFLLRKTRKRDLNQKYS